MGEVERVLAADHFDEVFGFFAEVVVGRVCGDFAEVIGNRPDVFGDGPFVVVEDDDESFGVFLGVVEGFEADAARERCVAGDHHDVFIAAEEVACGGHADGGGQSGSGVSGAVAIVFALGAEEESVQPFVLPDGVEPV
ncbi:MAG: hypothetical protein RIS92_2727 [Verrucomicrobiota bacterium]